MATLEEELRKIKEKEEAEKINPLLKLELGDLLKQKSKMEFTLKEYAFYDMAEQIPPALRGDYFQYQSIIQELNRRGREYTRIPRSEIIFGQANR